MPFEILEVGGVPVKMWIPEDHDFETEARLQLGRTSRLPVVRFMAAMPDVHFGMGATVGSVIATQDAVIPAAVGVDIGCGMVANRLSLTASQLPESLAEIRATLEEYIPHGTVSSSSGRYEKGSWGGSTPPLIRNLWRNRLEERYSRATERHEKAFSGRAMVQLGTMGGGNHFLELCLDEAQRVWIMLHSGSRHMGKQIGEYFTGLAYEQCKAAHVSLEDPDLAYLAAGTDWYLDYLEALEVAQDYALTNRFAMMSRVQMALLRMVEAGALPSFTSDLEAVNCHHNYVSRERHYDQEVLVTRKGAVSAAPGQLGIIPGSMGAKSFIVQGKGNPDALNSCSHGAGRRMSRGAARRAFTTADLAEQTSGVECRKDADVVDEIPSAYKDIDAVIKVQVDAGMIEVVHTLKQVLCIKG